MLAKMIEQLEADLPPALFEPGRAESVRVSMRDGVGLRTRLLFPNGGGPWPAVLIRNPYPNMAPYLEAISIVWAKRGYAAVVQDCRGTGESAGDWVPFIHEGGDGLDTIEWMKGQSWLNGSIGTYGHSYLSAVQWAMADRVPPEVKAMCISGFTTERYHQNYMNGMFRHDVYTGWAIGNSGVKDLRTEGLFERAVHTKPHIEMDRRVIGTELPWYRQWITNVSPEDEYWSTGFWAELQQVPARIRTPILLADGWFDQHLDGMMRDYLKLSEETRRRSRFFIGPWTHAMVPSGDLAYPDHEKFSMMKEALLWFGHHLKGEPYPEPTGDLRTYVIGDGTWRSWQGGIAPVGQRRLFLRQEEASGVLADTPPTRQGKAGFTYDPDRPVPTKGGAGLLRYLSGEADAAQAASVVQDPPGTREDVLSFISEPVHEDLRIAGAMKIRLCVSTDADDTAFTANVMEVLPDGSAYNIRDGITSLTYRNGAARPLDYRAHDTAQIEIECWPITWTVKQGSRLRLDISSSNFPAYHAHPNVAGPWALQEEVKVAGQSVHFGGTASSYLDIPLAR